MEKVIPASFASDNAAPATPEVMQALIAANEGSAPAYGADKITAQLERSFAEIFERDVAIFPVSTGTAANALALAACAQPWGVVYCHEGAHVIGHETGAPTFFSGARLTPLEGPHGRIALSSLAEAIDRVGFGVVHESQPQVVSITQATEVGTVYRPDEILAIADFIHAHGMKLHMDGARFANAVVTLGVSPAEATWRAGVDILSYGATKNGAMAAEAVVAFDPALKENLGFLRKRAGHLMSKQRYASAQIAAGFRDGLWLKWAAHANAMAQRLAAGLKPFGEAAVLHPVEANEVFPRLPEPVLVGLQADGFVFHRRPAPNRQVIRLVTSWHTKPEEVDSFIQRALHHAGLKT